MNRGSGFEGKSNGLIVCQNDNRLTGQHPYSMDIPTNKDESARSCRSISKMSGQSENPYITREKDRNSVNNMMEPSFAVWFSFNPTYLQALSTNTLWSSMINTIVLSKIRLLSVLQARSRRGLVFMPVFPTCQERNPFFGSCTLVGHSVEVRPTLKRLEYLNYRTHAPSRACGVDHRP